MPYVTEEIWQKIRTPVSSMVYGGSGMKDSIMISEYPESLPRDSNSEEDMSYVIEAVTGIRTIRGELNIAPSLRLNAEIRTYSESAENILRDNIHYVKSLAKAGEMTIGMNVEKPDGSATSVRSAMEIFVPLKGVLNIAAEIDRLRKDEAKTDTAIVALNRKLFNDDFIQKAPKEIIEKEKAKYEELITMKERIAESIRILKEAR
jgi:valyl-tRNA synthetase